MEIYALIECIASIVKLFLSCVIKDWIFIQNFQIIIYICSDRIWLCVHK